MAHCLGKARQPAGAVAGASVAAGTYRVDEARFQAYQPFTREIAVTVGKIMIASTTARPRSRGDASAPSPQAPPHSPPEPFGRR